MLALHAFVALICLGEASDTGSLGVLAVAPPPGPGTELVEITLQVRQVTTELHGGALDTRALRERMAGPERGAALAELDRAYVGARAAWVRGDFVGSLRTLRAIIGDLDRLPDGPERFKQWTRATMRLARSELDLGQEAAARGVVERLLRAAPDVAVDGNLHPARFIDQVERARAALNALPRRALAVTSSVDGARVYVEGRDVGSAPVTLELAQGHYRVSGATQSTSLPSVQVDLVDGDGELLLDFAIPEALRPAQGPGLALPDGDRARWLVEAGGYLRLDAVLAVTLAREGGAWYVAGALYDVRRGMLRREGKVRLIGMAIPAGGASALVGFLLTGDATSELVEYPGGPVPKPPPAPAGGGGEVKPDDAHSADASHLVQKPLVRVSGGSLGWATLGTGVAALGLASYGLIEGRSASSSYRRAQDLRSSGGVSSSAALAAYNRYVSNGDAARRRATIGWAGASACVLASGVLGYVNYRRTGEFGPFRF